jgi:hypothetical protein
MTLLTFSYSFFIERIKRNHFFSLSPFIKGKASKTPKPTKAMLAQPSKASKNPTSTKAKLIQQSKASKTPTPTKAMLVQQSKASKTPTRQVIRPPPIPYEYGTSHDLLVGLYFYTHGRLQNWWYFIFHPSNG